MRKTQAFLKSTFKKGHLSPQTNRSFDKANSSTLIDTTLQKADKTTTNVFASKLKKHGNKESKVDFDLGNMEEEDFGSSLRKQQKENSVNSSVDKSTFI
jgi:hypothetical protein